MYWFLQDPASLHNYARLINSKQVFSKVLLDSVVFGLVSLIFLACYILQSDVFKDYYLFVLIITFMWSLSSSGHAVCGLLLINWIKQTYKQKHTHLSQKSKLNTSASFASYFIIYISSGELFILC